VAGIAAAIVVGSSGFDEAAKARRFDRQVWLQSTEYCSKSARGRMVDDLVANHLELGMGMTSVRALLGAPDEIDGGTWAYNVSSEYGGFLPTCVGLQLHAVRGHLTQAVVTRDD
jgi:hypothetical protein